MTAGGVALGWPALLAFVAAIAGPFFVWLGSRRKTDVDESGLVLGEWKKISEEHRAQYTGLRAELAELRARIGALEEENRQLRIENDGLKRQLAQRSQSEVVMLGGAIGGNAPSAKQKFAGEEDLIARLDDAGKGVGR